MKPNAHVNGRWTGVTLFISASFLLTACATQPQPAGGEVPGFLMGLLHGFLIFFSFIGSLFTEHRIYAFPNAGVWYDFGYLLGASGFLSGSGAGSSKRLRR